MMPPGDPSRRPFPPPQEPGPGSPVFAFGPPPRPPPKQLPTSLKAILYLKGAGAIVGILLSMVAFMTLGKIATETTYLEHDQSVKMGRLLLFAAAVSFVQLVGVWATFNFKKWGVLTILAFSLLNVLVRVRAGGGSIFVTSSVLVTVALAALVFPRWADFE